MNQTFRLVISPSGRLHDGDYSYYHQTRVIVGEVGREESLLNEVAFSVDTTEQDNDGIPPQDSVVKMSRDELVRLQAAISYVLT